MSWQHRQDIIDRMRKLRAEVAQIFIDTEHWNASVRKPGEARIDPDPDGELARLGASLDAALRKASA